MRKYLLAALMGLAVILGLSGAPALATASVTTASVIKPGPTVAHLSVAINADGKMVPLSKDSKARAAKADSTQACTTEPDGKCYWYWGGMFAQRNICFQNNVGVFWNYEQAEAGLESGTATIKFYNHGPSTATPAPCTTTGGWNYWQILTYQAYTTNDGHCAHFDSDVDVNGYFNGPTVIWMNASPSRPVACTDTTQHKNNRVSNAIGTIVGLSPFTSTTTFSAAVMNQHYSESYNFPGTDDRNALYWLYLLQ